MANKNTIYTNALVNFLLDTKPYSRKLTEVNEIYRLNESMNVNVVDDLFSGVKIKPTWNYNFFSGGTGNSQPIKIQRIIDYKDYGRYVNNQPSLSKGAYKVGRDESGSLLSIPLAYDPKSLTGVGLKDVYVQKNGDPLKQNYLVEGIDAFLSHGVYSFQIKQIGGSNVAGTFIEVYTTEDGPFPIEVILPFAPDELIIGGPCEQVSLSVISITGPGEVRVYGIVESSNYNPRYQELKSDGVIAAARSAALELALNNSNPYSAISKISTIIDAIDNQLSATPNSVCEEQLSYIQTQLSANKLPYSYEALINALLANSIPVIPGYADWYTVANELSNLSPRLLFNEFTDIGQQKPGVLRYANLINDQIQISNIIPNYDHHSYEEITVEAISSTQLLISGSESESLGVVQLGETFTSSVISFFVEGMATPLNIGDKFVLTPTASITIGKNAIAEQWNIIKVNPLAYSNPIFTSARNSYARVVSQSGASGQITFLDQNFPSGILEFTAISETQMTVSCENEPDYTPIITIGQAFNDGRLAFTVINGTSFPLRASDRISMEVVNESPKAEDLGLYFGYDTDAYDANNLVYNNVSSAIESYLSTLDFGYDGRFINYDFETFNLVLSGAAISNRTWRIRALANLDRPLLMPSRIVNLLGTDDPTNPSATALYDSVNDVTSDGAWSAIDPDSEDDLELWYADLFALEYQDGESGNWVQVRNDIVAGQRYDLLDSIGLAFTLVPALKPFIASRVTSSYFEDADGPYVTRVIDGGDTIQFTTVNPAPRLNPDAVVRSNAPRLIMYGDSFHNATPAVWTITKTQTAYSLQGVYTSDENQGTLVYSAPLQLSVQDGLSFLIDEHNLHWTIVEGRGIEVGDSFSFETYVESATYLVNGSVSGWQKPAFIGKWYWNGFIGFKINPARAEVFYNDAYVIETTTNKWMLDIGDVEITYLRADLESRLYEAVSTSTSTWDLICNGCLIDGGSLNVEHLPFFKVTLPSAPEGTTVKIQISGDERHLSLGHDLVIVNADAINAPVVPDFVVIERIDHESIQIAIKTLNQDHLDSLQLLNPVTIDSRYFNATESAALESPELGILANWVPIQLRFKSPSGSETVFGNIATELSIRTISTAEDVGSVKSLTSNLNDSVYLTWNSDFYEKYLPLNSETVIVPRLSGANENVSVKIAENVNFLISSSGLDESSLFNENISVEIAEDIFLTVRISQEEIFGVGITDGPFTGFLPGFDNLPYDYELQVGDIDAEGGGYYDAGLPLVDMFYRTRILASKSELTPQEQLELNDSVGLLGSYLLNGDILATDAEYVISRINAAAVINNAPTIFGLGIPDNGAGFAITEKSISTASSSVIDMANITSTHKGTTYDARGYDVGLYDEMESATTYLAVSNLQLYMPMPVNISYESFETDLQTLSNVNMVQLAFETAPIADPEIYIWENSWSRAVLAEVEKTSNKEYLVSVPQSNELKIGIMPSPLELFANNEPGVWYDPTDVRLDWRYNLLTKTEQFDDAVWPKGGATVAANAATAPDGTLTADKLVESATTGQHGISAPGFLATAGSPVEFSVSMLPDERSVAVISTSDFVAFGGVWRFAVFDLSNGSILFQSGLNSASISEGKNGFSVLRVSATPVSSGAVGSFIIKISNGIITQGPSYTGDGTSGIYIWGASLTTAANADKPYQKITDGVSDYFTYHPYPTLFQDTAGTIPVTAAEQPVALMFDKSKNLLLISQSLTNGGFNADTNWVKGTGWSITGNIETGRAVHTGTAGFLSQSNAFLLADSWYRIKITVLSITPGSSIQFTGAFFTQTRTITTTGTFTFFSALKSNTFSIYAVGDVSIDDVIAERFPGNHAIQSTLANRPVLSARYNLASKTEMFDDSLWVKTNATVSSNVLIAPTNSLSADKLVESATSGEHYIRSANIPLSSGVYVCSVYWHTSSERNLWLRPAHLSESNLTSSVIFYKDTLQLSAVSGNGISATAADMGNGWWKISLVFSLSIPGNVQHGIQCVSTAGSYVGDGVSGVFIWGASILPIDQADMAYQKVNTSADYDVTGFIPYLRTDGVNDWMVANNVDFSSTDKATIIAGIRKQNNTSSVVAELSTDAGTNNGSFALISGEELGGRYSSVSRGDALLSTNQQAIFSDAGFAPDVAVISATHDISTSLSNIRRNSEDGINAIGNKGAGNFGNYPLYLFSRGGATLPFNGNLYSLIITGKEISAQQLLAFEGWTNHKTLAYIDPLIINEQVIGF